MGNAQVIEFPKAQSVRKRLQDKAQEQKAAVVLSIASVLLMTVFLNQWLVAGPDSLTGNSNRNVASFEPTSFIKDVKWEHDLAKRLSSDKSSLTANLAEAPTVRDELIFGYLEGKYGMKVGQGRIESLEFIDAQAGEHPMAINDKVDFLMKYSEAFGMNYNTVSMSEQSTANEQVYTLVGSGNQIMGKAHFALDEEGRVHTISFTR